MFKWIRVSFQLYLIRLKQGEIMAAIDDLSASVTTLQATTEVVLKRIDELKNNNNDSAIAAATATINEAVGKLNTAIQ